MVRRRRNPKAATKSLSLADLREILEKRISQERKKLPALQRKRDKLAGQLEEIDSEIAAIEGSAPARSGTAKRRGRKPGRRSRRANGVIRETRGGKMTIPAAIQQVLQEAGEPMKAADIKDAILKKKLIKKPKKSFAAQVNMALSKHKAFKKKARGVYSL